MSTHGQDPESAVQTPPEHVKNEAGQTITDASDDHEVDASRSKDYIKEDVRQNIPTALWILVVLTMLSSTFLFSLDNTIVADIQPSIIEEFGEVEKLSWLGVAFVLSASTTVVTWGKLYGIFSAKWLYISAILIFEVGSTVCGAAGSMNTEIVGRAIAGIGGAGMYVGCLVLLSITTSIGERPNYMAFTGITWGSGTVLGPVIGGAFAENTHATWRWAFYINLCIGAALAPIYFLYLPRGDPQKSIPVSKKLYQLDYLGIILNIGGYTALILAISFGGTEFAWSDGREIACWVVAGVLLIAFALQQGFAVGTTKETRTFPADFLRKKIMWLLFICQNAASTCVFVPVFYIPLYFQFVRGDSPLKAAVRLLPFICLLVFAGLANGAIMSQPKFGFYIVWYFFGGILTTIGGSLMYTVDEYSSNSRVYGYSAILAIGAGMFVQSSVAVAQAKVPHSRASDAGGFIALAQTGGIVLALSISGAVFQNIAIQNLEVLLPFLPTSALRGLVSGAASDVYRSLPAELRQQVLATVVDAMSRTYVLVITAGALTLVCSLFMDRERLIIEMVGAG